MGELCRIRPQAEAGRRRWRRLVWDGLAATLPRRLFLTRGPTAGESVCLTFDDGPHPEHTPRLLDRLRELGIVATFFVEVSVPSGSGVQFTDATVNTTAAPYIFGTFQSPPPDTFSISSFPNTLSRAATAGSAAAG